MITLKEDDMDDHPNLFKPLRSQDRFQSRKSLFCFITTVIVVDARSIAQLICVMS